jgi:thioredoxin 1
MTAATGSKQQYGQVHHVSKTEFVEQVLESKVPVLVDFYADWCGPCRLLSPVLDELAQETPEAKIVKVNIDQSPKIAAQYRVNSIPTLVLFEQGKPISQVVGLAPKQTLKKMLPGAAQ